VKCILASGHIHVKIRTLRCHLPVL
jgi:hypothetical protein